MGVKAALAPLLLAFHRGMNIAAPPPDGTFRILLFHDVSKSEQPVFSDLIGGLARRGLLIGPKEAEARLVGAGGAPAWLISFDDGFASNARVARDVLDPLGIKALFFVCPGLVDLPAAEQPAAIATNVFRGRRGASDVPGLMTWAELESLVKAGHAVGNHTLSHRRLTGLGDSLAAEVGGAAERLAARLGPTPWFAYTFGDIMSIDAIALAEIARHHRYCRSGVRGTNGPDTHPLALRADSIGLSTTASWCRLEVEGGLDARYGRARRRLDRLAAGFPLRLS